MSFAKTACTFAVLTSISLGSAIADSPRLSQKAKKPTVIDVELGKNGTLTGFVVDSQGKPMTDERVELFQGKKRVSLTKTGSKGEYQIEGLRGGVYRISSKQGHAVYRVWQQGTAPKKSYKYAMVVASKGTIVRAQDGDFVGLPAIDGVSWLNLATTGTVLGLSIANYQENQDSSDAISALQQQISILTNTPANP